MIRLIYLIFILSVSNASLAATGPDVLFKAIDERLELMDDVAAYKWTHKLPIEDLERERVVIDRATETALNLGVRPQGLREFFRQQIEAAKDIQRYWFRQFEAGLDPGSPPDLAGEIRPELLRLGDIVTTELSINAPLLQFENATGDFSASVNVEGLSEDRRTVLLQALTAVEKYPDRLVQIRETGKLRVGTTGDYAPFSFDASGELAGIDIDLARDLAASLDVDVVFVQTTWPTLLKDLGNGLYDVGMSGISYNVAREKVGAFTRPYHTGGKTPIGRCDEVGRLDTLAKIDQPGVRVIVNPGGTNQRFVTNNLKKAQVTVHDDNRTIFEEISEGRADVMITDAIEVTLKSNQFDNLCAAMPGKTLTKLTKAYLMPQDEELNNYVDNWLKLRLDDGTVDATFRRHLTKE